MKNKFLIYILIFISIICFSSCKTDVKEKINEKNFNLTQSETENIDKIIMSDKGGNIITLEKEKEEWIINSKYPVWKRQIEYTLNVMKDIRIKSSVSEQKTKVGITEIIATTGVKVEIFEKEEKIKSYYIGGNTSDHQGTYMIMENAEECICDAYSRQTSWNFKS